MKRLNFTLDDDTVALLDNLADHFYEGNKSATVRAALEYLSEGMREGWIIAGYTAASVDADVSCHSCGTPHHAGEVLYSPVFERGARAGAMAALPTETWLDCSDCVVRNAGA